MQSTYLLHIPLVSFFHPRRKGNGAAEIQMQHLGMTCPGGKQALKDLSLNLKSPSPVDLLGQNGADKSALMKLPAAALTPTAGTILVDGQPPPGTGKHGRSSGAISPRISASLTS